MNIPKNPDLETEVLAMILQNPGTGLCKDLSDSDFTYPNKLLFPVIEALDSLNKLTPAKFQEELRKSGILERVSDSPHFADLLTYDFVPVLTFQSSVSTLKNYSERRHGISVMEQSMKDAGDLTREFRLDEAAKELLSGKHTEGSQFLRFMTPGECAAWVMPGDYNLVGDYHLVRGGVSIIGGVPGCGKSRVLAGLGIAGATRADFMGLPVHSKFRTLIIQAENGPARLKTEFEEIQSGLDVDLDQWMRVTPPGRAGLPLHDPFFRNELREYIQEFRPGVVALDPWNRIVLDDKQKDYRAAIDWIHELLPERDEDKPAVVIVAHLRKRGNGDGRKRGRDLLQEISGSGMIGSAARSVFILEPASPDQEDDRLVWTCAKNNDGREGASSAWYRSNGLFAPCHDLDLDEFFGGNCSREKITEATMRDALRGGVTKKRAKEKIQELTGCGDSAAYGALALGGRFKGMIDETPEGLLIWIGGE